MASSIVPPNVRAVDAQGRGVQIRFVWGADRFSHIIDRVDGGIAVAVLSSIESDASAEWPHSPPIQQISVERIGPDEAALGVGAAGVSHWSISVLATEIDNRPALQFDIAARTTGPVEHLGSTYNVLADEWGIQRLDEVAPAKITVCERTVSIRPLGGDGKTYRWAYAVLGPAG